MRKLSNDIICVNLDVDGKPLRSSRLTSTSRNLAKFNRLTLHKTGLSLKTYTEENLMLVEVLKVPVDYQNQREVLDL